MNKENESGMKQNIAFEIRKLRETRVGKKKRTISCLNEDCTTINTSKEKCNKQLLKQREENQRLNVKLKTEIDSGTKIKILDKENQDEITRVKV